MTFQELRLTIQQTEEGAILGIVTIEYLELLIPKEVIEVYALELADKVARHIKRELNVKKDKQQ